MHFEIFFFLKSLDICYFCQNFKKMENFLPLLFVISVLMGLSLLGLGLQTFFSSKKKFPETHIGHNKEMRKRGIYCSKTQQKMIDKGIMKGQNFDASQYNCCGDNCAL
jgi:hypothetical protein